MTSGVQFDRRANARTASGVWAAGILRDNIIAGNLLPGARLSEKELISELGVSRNVLREAFQLLVRENLLDHELNRGISVRRVTLEDLVQIYRVRRFVECNAIRPLTEPPAEGLGALRKAVADGDAAAADGRWQDLGTANMHFHQAIAAVAGSERLDELMAGVLAELRLVFHGMPDRRRFHEPYLAHNHEILRLLEAGDGDKAADALAEYLDVAENQLRATYAEPAADAE